MDANLSNCPSESTQVCEWRESGASRKTQGGCLRRRANNGFLAEYIPSASWSPPSPSIALHDASAGEALWSRSWSRHASEAVPDVKVAVAGGPSRGLPREEEHPWRGTVCLHVPPHMLPYTRSRDVRDVKLVERGVEDTLPSIVNQDLAPVLLARAK